MISGSLLVVIAITFLLALFIIGLPVFAAFIIANILGVYLMMGSSGFGLFANSIYDTATTGSLATVALFLLMGEILFRGKAVDVLFRSIDALVPNVKGREHYLIVALATVFGALSGAAMAVAAMLGRSMLPTVQARGQDIKLATGAILAGASLAPIIPPSILVIIIGTLAGVSISALLVAGIVPGLVLSGLFTLYIFIKIHLKPSIQQLPGNTEVSSNYDAKVDGSNTLEFGISRTSAVLRLLPFSLIFLMILGFILLGIATPSEAAATGVLGALITTALYGGLTLQVVWEALKSAAAVAAMILLVMAASKMFTQLLAFSGGTAAITSLVVGLGYDKWIMLLILMGFPFILCMFIDQIALMLLVIPVYRPVIDALAFDPVWFWTLFLINMTLGGMTPPFGYTMFALKGAAENVSLGEIYRASWPFVGLFLLGMVLLTVFPRLVTWLPEMI